MSDPFVRPVRMKADPAFCGTRGCNTFVATVSRSVEPSRHRKSEVLNEIVSMLLMKPRAEWAPGFEDTHTDRYLDWHGSRGGPGVRRSALGSTTAAGSGTTAATR
jgi:hypothetical protein